jgi:hypothetical protein
MAAPADLRRNATASADEPRQPSTAPDALVTASVRLRALFHIKAAAEPGLLPRLIEPVAKLGHVPIQMHACREAGDGSELSVDLRLGGIEGRIAARFANALRAVVGVHQVIAVFEAEQ